MVATINKGSRVIDSILLFVPGVFVLLWHSTSSMFVNAPVCGLCCGRETWITCVVCVCVCVCACVRVCVYVCAAVVVVVCDIVVTPLGDNGSGW